MESKEYLRHVAYIACLHCGIVPGEADIDKVLASASKTYQPQKRSVSDRELEFITDVSGYLTKYPKEMLREFCSYWTEKNPNGQRMRFEMQKVFDLSRRLATWNSKNFNHNGNRKQQQTQSTADYLKEHYSGKTDVK